MADSQNTSDEAEPLTLILCGERCEHAWDGPEVAWGNGASITCSKCGACAGDEAMWGE